MLQKLTRGVGEGRGSEEFDNDRACCCCFFIYSIDRLSHVFLLFFLNALKVFPYLYLMSIDGNNVQNYSRVLLYHVLISFCSHKKLRGSYAMSFVFLQVDFMSFPYLLFGPFRVYRSHCWFDGG